MLACARDSAGFAPCPIAVPRSERATTNAPASHSALTSRAALATTSPTLKTRWVRRPSQRCTIIKTIAAMIATMNATMTVSRLVAWLLDAITALFSSRYSSLAAGSRVRWASSEATSMEESPAGVMPCVYSVWAMATSR